MVTRETRLARGRRRGNQIQAGVLAQLREARITEGISQSAIAAQLGVSQASVSMLEAGKLADVSIVRIAEIAWCRAEAIHLTFSTASDADSRQGPRSTHRSFSRRRARVEESFVKQVSEQGRSALMGSPAPSPNRALPDRRRGGNPDPRPAGSRAPDEGAGAPRRGRPPDHRAERHSPQPCIGRRFAGRPRHRVRRAPHRSSRRFRASAASGLGIVLL